MPSLTQYFNYWSQPAIENDRSINRGPLIRPYYTDQLVLSLELLIPVDWTQLYLAEQPQTGRQETPGALPKILSSAIRRLGFRSSQQYGGTRLHQGPRRYILRPHSYPLSVALYKERILPRLNCYDSKTGMSTADERIFERVHEYAQFLYRADMLQLEALETNNPQAYIQQLLRLDYWLV
ncbi:hypothetical protein WKW50_23605 [Ochrobactrum sp. GPK 3]|uniref:hypothetical protein n=1 Tax=Brucella sp. 22210 TaxID=3453892 RepID=UPI0031384D4F